MNEAVSGVAPFGLTDFRAGMAEVHGGAPRLPSVEGPSGAVPSAGGPAGRSQAAGELMEPAAPREVHLVAGHPMTAKDKIDKQALRAR